jgi:hypothetical protein
MGTVVATAFRWAHASWDNAVRGVSSDSRLGEHVCRAGGRALAGHGCPFFGIGRGVLRPRDGLCSG